MRAPVLSPSLAWPLTLLSWWLWVPMTAVAQIPFDAPEDAITMVWRGVPLEIALNVKQDRTIRFVGATRIQVGMPTHLQGIASAESLGGVVHLRSVQPISRDAWFFRDKDSGEVYRLDIHASEGTAPQAPVLVVKPAAPAPSAPAESAANSSTVSTYSDLFAPSNTDASAGVSPDQSQAPSAPDVAARAPVRHGITTLIRYAFQHIYAPERLITELPEVSRLSVEATAVDMLAGEQVSAQVIAQWYHTHRYVTAFLLHNQHTQSVQIDPRLLRGSRFWESAALRSDTLAAHAHPGDTTALVVISDQRWEDYAQWLH